MDALITMTGWVGGDVEYRSYPGFTTASFRLGCTPRINRQGSWTDAPTTWITVTCYRGLADHVAGSLRRGDPVVVAGRLRTQVWQGKEDGMDHERVVLEAGTVGHDLTRGTSVFTKAERPVTDAGAAASQIGDVILRAEQGAGQRDTDEEEVDEDSEEAELALAGRMARAG